MNMNVMLFLFCGGPAMTEEGLPKPLMKVKENRSLLYYFLLHLKYHRPVMPSGIIILCDDCQKGLYEAEINSLSYPVPIKIQNCGLDSSTFQKFEKALDGTKNDIFLAQFGYPDIFFFNEYTEPKKEDLESSSSVHISATTLTSRFPRLIVDIYNNEIRGISNYNSFVPANPLYVFGGDLWGNSHELRMLIAEFKSLSCAASPSLEYDFFFWLINHKKIRCVMLYGERIWVDSIRDIHKLTKKIKKIS